MSKNEPVENGKSSQILSESPEPLSDQEVAQTKIPVANVSPRVSRMQVFGASYMWVLALLCLLVAIGVAWWSRPEQGVEVTIHFPEGHGLRAEDAVRFRGIDVGIVEDVKLNRQLDGVDVHVNLFPAAEAIAREGSRFWIVRPELSLAGISGLETAVGHKYIGVIPGDPSGNWQNVFEGLTNSPPDALENRGIEIILRGEKRHSITPDSPVLYRGVVIGQVLSVELSQDGRFVDTRAKIFENHAMFVSSKSRFWPASGVDVEVSLTSGMKLNTESLETLLQGGISVLTTENGGEPIEPGQVFRLYDQPNEDWFAAARQVQATDVELRGAIPMQIRWKQKGLLGTSEKSASFVGTAFEKSNARFVLIPSDILEPPRKAVEGSLRVGMEGIEESFVETSTLPTSERKFVVFELPAQSGKGINAFSRYEIASIDKPTRCLAVRSVRKPGRDSSKFEFFHYTIEAIEIGDAGKLNHFDGDRSVWHGSPVLSTRTGNLVGMLLIEDNESRIEPVTKELVE